MKKIPNKKEIDSLKEQIDELKEEQQAFIEVCQMPCKDCKLNVIKRVLQGHLRGLNSTELLAKLDAPKLYTEMTPEEQMIETQKIKTEKKEASVYTKK